MRFFIIGLDDDGRSNVVEQRQIDGEIAMPRSGLDAARLWGTREQPPELPVPRHAVDDAWMDLGVGPGASRWVIVNFGPDYLSEMHHTSTLDYDLIVAGSITLELECGKIPLTAGDCVVIPGCMHRWRAGAEGCTMSAVTLGLEGDEVGSLRG